MLFFSIFDRGSWYAVPPESYQKIHNTTSMDINTFSIEAFREGDEHTYEWVFRRFYKSLAFFADQFLKDSFAAEEIAGNVLLKLWEKHRDFANLDSIKAFLYISTKNACLNYLDKEKRRYNRRLTLRPEKLSDESVLQEIFRSETLRQISDAIDRLPEKYGKVIRMAYIRDMSNDEIATELALPGSTVRNQKARGLVALKKFLPPSSFILLILIIH